MGSIITTPNTRKGYTKGGSPRMKISETNTYQPGRVIVESSFTGSEYRKHLDSQKTRGNPAWEKESESLNAYTRLHKMMQRKHRQSGSSPSAPANPGDLPMFKNRKQ